MSPVNEITTHSASAKDVLTVMMPWFAWSITHILNKIRKGEKMSLLQHLSHLSISWFVGYLSYLACQYFGITGDLQGIVIWITTYSWIQIVEALEMFKAKVIFDIILDFINYKKWEK